MATKREIETAGLGERISALPGFARAQAAAARVDAPVYVVGGAVRDALLGHATANLDLVIEGDQMLLIEALDGAAVIHDRFETATVEAGGAELDIARARTESYPYPGALPEVEPAELGRDLERRDFTVNAIAVAVADPGLPIDPLGGVDDLAAGMLRVMHDGSFADDPTRALRAARYAARLGFEPEPRTLELLRATDFATVSADRVATELAKLAAETTPGRASSCSTAGASSLGAGAGPLIDAASGSSSARLGTASRPGRRPCSPPLAARGPPPTRSPKPSPGRPPRGRRRPRPRARSTSCSPGRSVPSGSTTTCELARGGARDLRRRPDRGRGRRGPGGRARARRGAAGEARRRGARARRGAARGPRCGRL